MELLIIVVTLVAGLPLFVACVIMAQRDMGLTYLEDKSTWNLETEYEMQDIGGKYCLIPVDFTPLSISIEQAATMMYVQDEYGVPSTRKVYYKWDETDYTKALVDYNKTGDADKKADYNWSVPYRQRAARVGVGNATDCVAEIAKKDTVAPKIGEKYYMVWNSSVDSWMITGEVINTIGIER